MRKLAPVLVGLAIAVVGSVVQPAAAIGSGSSPGPARPGPRAAAQSTPGSITSPIQRPSVAGPVNCDSGFHSVASPNGAQNNDLFGTAAVSASDVWAVGITNASGNYDQPLVEHWDGTSWTIVSTPSPNTAFFADLNGVAAISTNDVWAVGDYQIDASGFVSAFAEHWNGSSWTLVSVAQPMNFNYLFAVNAVSSSDVWAVGASNSAGFFTLVEHWNGSSWSVVASPNQMVGLNFESNQLFSVSAFSSTDVWAVGSFYGSVPRQSLAEHWDGATWSIVTTPNGTSDNEIASVVALEAGHAGGVGYGNYTQGVSTRQVEVWNLLSAGGSTNSISAGPGTGDNVLEAVDRSGAAVWAVGFQRATLTAPRNTLAIPATWNGATHTLTWGSPGGSNNPAAINDVLFAASAVSPYSFWGAGYQNNGGVDQTLTESYCPVQFAVAGPPSATAGASFSVTVTVQNGSGAIVTGYAGTAHFTSIDPTATLPADYTFVPTDMGTHIFSGVVLNTPCRPTITVGDVAMPLTIPGTAAVRLAPGVCQSSGGTAGSRGANTGPGGTAGNQSVNQSSPGTPGPRWPRLDQRDVAAPGLSTPETAATSSSSQQSSTRQVSVGPAAAPAATTAVEAAQPAMLPVAHSVAQRVVVAPPAPAAPLWPLVLASLVLPTIALMVRRRLRRARGG